MTHRGPFQPLPFCDSVRCDQVNDLLSLVAELKEEGEMLRSNRECDREVDWWSRTLPSLRPRQQEATPREAENPLPSAFCLPPSSVTPIYKQDRKEDPGNYRTVSLRSVPGETVEQFILSALTGHVKDNHELRPSQNGLMKGRSCLTTLISFYDQVTRLMYEGKAVKVR